MVVQDNILVAIHGKENIDSSGEGRMVGIRIPTELPAPGEPQKILKDKDPKIADGKAWELWRLQHSMFTSSPVLVNGRVYQVSKTGVLVCVDIKTGKELFAKKINNDQIHSSPLYADGHLYLGFPNGRFLVVKPGDDDAEIVSEVKLEGGILESFGRMFKHDLRLYVYPAQDEGGGVVTAGNLRVRENLQGLYDYLVGKGFIRCIDDFNEEYLSIYSRDVLEKIRANDGAWEAMVPGRVAAIIKERGLLGLKRLATGADTR